VTIDPEISVCPRCGNPTGARRFCMDCGLNLSQQQSVPTRAEWEARPERISTPLSTSEVQATPGDLPDADSVSTSMVSDPDSSLPRNGPPDGNGQAPRSLGTYFGFAVAVMALSALALLLFSYQAARWIVDVNNYLGTGSIGSLNDAGSARSAIRTAYLVILVAVVVTPVGFIPWFFVAYRNLERRGMGLRFAPGWAIGSWFVPVLALFRPKQIANDLWRGSHSTSDNLAADQTRSVTSLLHWWWALYIIGNVIFAVGEVISSGSIARGDSLRHILSVERGGFYLAIIGALALIASLVLLAISAYRITAAQDGGVY